jgi:hypothetical protein
MTAPTSGFGLTAPRPPAASSSALLIGVGCPVATFRLMAEALLQDVD